MLFCDKRKNLVFYGIKTGILDLNMNVNNMYRWIYRASYISREF